MIRIITMNGSFLFYDADIFCNQFDLFFVDYYSKFVASINYSNRQIPPTASDNHNCSIMFTE